MNMKPSGIGGQAVIEGVMMKNKEEYAIAVRKPDNTIIIEKNHFTSKSEKYKIFKLPIFRGILNFLESMVMGMKTLSFSASFYEEEDTEPTKVEKAFNKVFKSKTEKVVMGLTVAFSLVMAITIFMLLPYFIAELISRQTQSTTVLTLIEGALRIVIFLSYIIAISRLKDIQRLFMYHGAEHKAINCIENGYELTIENVKWQSREHKRCGTSFTFLVMFISIIFFMFIRVDEIWLRILVRLLLIPIISGVAYEFIRFAGRNDSLIVRIISKPGMLLQKFTTREPDEDMIEVAIKSVEAVFDWKAFIAEDELEIVEQNTIEISPEFNLSQEDESEEDEVLKALEQIVKEH